jgi:hypothetical protein
MARVTALCRPRTRAAGQNRQSEQPNKFCYVHSDSSHSGPDFSLVREIISFYWLNAARVRVSLREEGQGALLKESLTDLAQQQHRRCLGLGKAVSDGRRTI